MRIFRPIVAAVAAAGLVAFSAWPASANLLISIDKSTQTMTVSQDGSRLYTWPVSTGVRGYDTPNGTFTPFRMEKDHFSKEWDDAPMPNSIFFTQRGHAIHGTNHSSIGRPASHGCVRLSVAHSRVLFDLVKQEGMSNTKVVLYGDIPRSSAPLVARRTSPDDRAGFTQPGYDDDEARIAMQPRGAVPVYPGDQRPLYWRQEPNGPYGYEPDTRYQRLPPPPRFFFPGQRYGWD